MHGSYAANMQGALSSGAGVQVLISFSSHHRHPTLPMHIQTNYWPWKAAAKTEQRTLAHQLPQEWCEVITPMHIDFWRTELATYQDERFVAWICKGIEHGFRVGFSDRKIELHAHGTNQHAISHRTPTDSYRLHKRGT